MLLLYGNGLRFNPRRLYCCKRVSAFLIDETMVQIGPDHAWLWVAVEPIHREIRVYISRHRNNMIVAERECIPPNWAACQEIVYYSL